MKTRYKIIIGIFCGLFLFGLIGSIIAPIEVEEKVEEEIEVVEVVDKRIGSSYKQQNIIIIENALIKEITERGICNEYEIDGSWIRLWCYDELSEFGQHVVMGRVYEDIIGLQGDVIYDITFRGIESRKTINIFYDYTF